MQSISQFSRFDAIVEFMQFVQITHTHTYTLSHVYTLTGTPHNCRYLHHFNAVNDNNNDADELDANVLNGVSLLSLFVPMQSFNL